MRISLDGLAALDAIARNGSFAKAAAELHRVPSALTYTVSQLEADLGVTLFDRSHRRATLTAVGHELLNEGRVLLKAAGDLECRIQQVARGWETELRIAVDGLINIESLFPLVTQFDREKSGTRIRLSTEVLGGNWDALVSERADLLIGAPNDVPHGGGFATLPFARHRFVFVAAPRHPLCDVARAQRTPLSESQIQGYRAVSVADSSRHLAPRTVGLLSGQDVLTVPSMQAKVAAHVAGLGIGYIPERLAVPFVKAKQLRILSVERTREAETVVAWRANRTGRALRWFAERLAEPKWLRTIEGHP